MARLLWLSALFLSVLQVSVSKPIVKRWDDFQVKHSWEDVPRGWELVGPAPADYNLHMKIGLKQDRMHELIDHLYQVSDPAHHRYGAHLTKAEVDALVSPHSDSVDIVDSWLAYHDIDPSVAVSRSDAGNWISMAIPVDRAEKMLGNVYNIYRHTVTSEVIVRTLNYSLPSLLHNHIDVVTPTTFFSTIRSMRTTSFLQPEILPLENGQDVIKAHSASVPSSCGRTITPACLAALYNTAGYVPTETATNSLGIAGYLDEYANHNDLQTFLQQFRTDAVGADFTVQTVNGGLDDQTNPGVEANLDIQYSIGISYPTPNKYYSTRGTPPFTPDANTPTNTNEPYLDWLNFTLAQPSIPQTISTSYGDDEQTVPLDYAISVCNSFAQLGARGSSVLFSSGDSGVGAHCTSNDGTDRKQFIPSFPASCPFVTAVGGTTGVNPEQAWSSSGGGFSNYFTTPSYQASAVASYKSRLGSTYAGLYNPSGRGLPDVAAQASGFQVVIGGRVSSVGGTSASSPTVAGIVALLNDYRLANGKTSLGFLNPLLYSTGVAGLNDITSGSNPGCETSGFSAGTGWDPVTGLGTLDFRKLQKIL